VACILVLTTRVSYGDRFAPLPQLMNPIYFETDRSDIEIPTIVSNLTNIVSWSVWTKRVKALKSLAKANPLWPDFIGRRHALELAFADVVQYYRIRGKYPWPRTASEQQFYSFALLLTEVFRRVGPKAQARLRGMLRTGLEKECGLGPLAHEMKVAAHLMSRGFEVCFHDLESGGGFDFLATSASSNIEIECKYISTDLGRKLHRRRVYDLGGYLYPVTKQYCDQEQGGMLIRVTVANRLTSAVEQQTRIRDCVSSLLLAGEKTSGDDECFVTAEAFDIQQSPFSSPSAPKSPAQVHDEARRYFGIDSDHALLHWKPNVAAVVISLKSAQPDLVLTEMVKGLKADSKAQFSGTLPAYLLLHLDEVGDEQLLELHNAEVGGERTGVGLAMMKILRDRPKLSAVVLMSEGQTLVTGQRVGDRKAASLQETGKCFIFNNPAQEGSRTLTNSLFF
jgi:hypothetical protein